MQKILLTVVCSLLFCAISFGQELRFSEVHPTEKSPAISGRFTPITTSVNALTCEEIALGTNQVDEAAICSEAVALFTIDGLVTVPEVGPEFGSYWIVSLEDISGSSDPFNEPSLETQFELEPGGDGLGLSNIGMDETSFFIYVTPVVYAGMSSSNGTLQGLDFSEGCNIVGNSVLLELLPFTDELTYSISSVEDTEPATNSGMISVENVTGGTPPYSYEWSTGENTTSISDLTNGIYFVTVTDANMCWSVVTLIELGVSIDIDNCPTALPIDGLLTGEYDDPMVAPQSSFAGLSPSPEVSNTDAGCFLEPGALVNGSAWYSFTGTGDTFQITTIDCGGNYEDDTQFVLYEGDDCENLVAIDCAEDKTNLPGVIDRFAAILTVPTVVGQTYRFMVDSYNNSNDQFCLQVTKINNGSCNSIAVGEATLLTDPRVCFGDDVSIAIDEGTVIPALNGVNGFLYVFSTTDISGSTDYFDDPSYIGDDGISSTDNNLFFTALNPSGIGEYYLTPAVYAGGIQNGLNITNFDYSNGCLLAGTSIMLESFGQVAALSVSEVIVAQDEIAGENGSISLAVSSGTGEYFYNWSNGDTTAMVIDLLAGDYTVTISDASGCVDDIVETYTVPLISSTNDPVLSTAVNVYPNPAQETVNLSYRFATATDFEFAVVNSLGQTLLSGRVSNGLLGREELSVQELQAGTYFLRLSTGDRQTVKPLVILR